MWRSIIQRRGGRPFSPDGRVRPGEHAAVGRVPPGEHAAVGRVRAGEYAAGRFHPAPRRGGVDGVPRHAWRPVRIGVDRWFHDPDGASATGGPGAKWRGEREPVGGLLGEPGIA